MIPLPHIAATALLTAALAAQPAQAQGNEQARSPQSQADRGQAERSAKPVKYCLSYEVSVGSRLEKQECRTREQWKALGVDIDEVRQQ